MNKKRLLSLAFVSLFLFGFGLLSQFLSVRFFAYPLIGEVRTFDKSTGVIRLKKILVVSYYDELIPTPVTNALGVDISSLNVENVKWELVGSKPFMFRNRRTHLSSRHLLGQTVVFGKLADKNNLTTRERLLFGELLVDVWEGKVEITASEVFRLMESNGGR